MILVCFQGMLWAYGLLAAIKPPAVIEPMITTVITTASTILPNITTTVNSVSVSFLLNTVNWEIVPPLKKKRKVRLFF